jgi:hypothetical protein
MVELHYSKNQEVVELHLFKKSYIGKPSKNITNLSVEERYSVLI